MTTEGHNNIRTYVAVADLPQVRPVSSAMYMILAVHGQVLVVPVGAPVLILSTWPPVAPSLALQVVEAL